MKPPFQRLIDDHAAPIKRFLVALVGPDDAEDCLQETFVSALAAYPRLRRTDNLKAWLFTIARNKAMDRHRDRVRTVPGAVPERASEDVPGMDPSLVRAIASLPEKQRSAVALRYVTDLPYREHRYRTGLHPGGRATERPRRHQETERGIRMKNIEQELTRFVDRVPGPDIDGLAERLADDAEIAYVEFDSPVGNAAGSGDRQGPHHPGLRGGFGDAILDRLARKVSPNIVRVPGRLDDVRRELDEYFAGARTSFDIALDWSLSAGFTRRS